MFLSFSGKPIFRTLVTHHRLFNLNAYNFGIIKQFRLPDLGEKIKDATVKKWRVKEGDIVEEYQPLCDVATDKLFTEIPSSAPGKFHKRVIAEDGVCQVGDVLYEIEVDEAHANLGPNGEVQAERQSAAPSPASTTASNETVQNEHHKNHSLATPATRSMIREHKLDISKISGTGKDGRITKEDVLNHMSGSSQQKEHKEQKSHKDHHKDHHKKDTHHKEAPKESKPAPAQFHRPASHGANAKTSSKTVQMSDFQKGMQKSMTEALQIPHFYYKDEIDMTSMSDLRERIKNDTQLKITFMPFIIKAFSLALQEYPIINSWYNKEKQFEYTLVDNINISFAIDSPKGLIVPNVKNTQDRSILEIHEEVTRIIKDAQNGTLGMKDLYDGTFSISNIGNIGGTYLGPIILAPQVCIVALGKTALQPKYIKDEKGQLNLQPRKIMNASFGCDHRVLDGATVARFSQKWKSYMENPENMLLHMK